MTRDICNIIAEYAAEYKPIADIDISKLNFSLISSTKYVNVFYWLITNHYAKIDFGWMSINPLPEAFNWLITNHPDKIDFTMMSTNTLPEAFTWLVNNHPEKINMTAIRFSDNIEAFRWMIKNNHKINSNYLSNGPHYEIQQYLISIGQYKPTGYITSNMDERIIDHLYMNGKIDDSELCSLRVSKYLTLGIESYEKSARKRRYRYPLEEEYLFANPAPEAVEWIKKQQSIGDHISLNPVLLEWAFENHIDAINYQLMSANNFVKIEKNHLLYETVYKTFAKMFSQKN